MGGGAGAWENKSQSSEFRLQERTRLSKLRPVRRISSTSDSLQKYLCGLTSLHGQHLLLILVGQLFPSIPFLGGTFGRGWAAKQVGQVWEKMGRSMTWGRDVGPDPESRPTWEAAQLARR